ncbi:MAG: VWA domain-containing protein [Planctomycetes bacterium]|nr:VWA domain-containing protein [Planctomycetota bacterium]
MLWDRPWLLLLLAALPAIVWSTARARSPLGPARRGIVAVLQVVAWAALVAALAGPWVERAPAVHRAAVVVPAGRGALADTEAARSLRAWRDATPFAEPFAVLTAGTRPRLAVPGTLAPPAADGAPDLAAALEQAAALIPPGAPGDIALLGEAGDAGDRPLGPIADAIASRGLRVHWRGAPHAPGFARVLRVRHPAALRVAEPFRVEIEVAAERPSPATLEISDADGAVLGRQPIAVRPGVSTHVVEARAPTRTGPVALRTRLTIDGSLGADPLRQEERTALLVEGRLRVLALTDAQAAASLSTTLAEHGFAVEQASGGGLGPSEAALTRADVVVVDDLPASAWSEEFQRAVRDGVLHHGRGLLLAGRDANLGPGGYADSPLADVLPVESPQREERRDPSVALVLIIDTSGSMGNRIELAKEVARLAVRRLMPHDKAGIVEFYGSKRWAAPLQPASNVIELLRALNRLQSGGGTIIYSALEEAYYALLNVHTRFKHVLVLTDGGVESGPFEALARRMAEAGINLNTVLIGPQANSPFLLNLAQWGRGRFYACPSRFQLPDLRFKEPQTTLLPAVRDGEFPLLRGIDSEATRALEADGVDGAVRGLVDARARPGAEVLLETTDGSRPVLAAWDQGAGRTAVLATDLLGPATEGLHDAGWATAVADLLRSLASGRDPRRASLDVDARRDALRLRYAAPGRPSFPAPEFVVTDAVGDELLRSSAIPDLADGFVAELPWPVPDVPLRIAVVEPLAGGAEIATAAAMRPLPRELRRRDRSAELDALAARTGGSAAVDGPLPAEPPATPAGAHVPRSLAGVLAQLALGAFLLSILARRWPLRRATRPRMAPAAAWLLVGVVGLASPSRAQPEPATTDPVTARIDAELLRTGDLDALAEEWRDGTLEQRVAVMRARGDLRGVLATLKDADEPTLEPLRVLASEALGELEPALAAVERELASEGDPGQRVGWLIRAAELAHALGRPAEDVDRRLREAADGAPAELRRAIGHVAAGLGRFALAVELHADFDAGDDPGRRRERSRTAMRRALWAERAGDVEAALAGWRLAAETAEQGRESGFALSRLLDVAARNERLGELVDGWIARFDSLDRETRTALLAALRELGRGNEALDLLARPSARDDDELQGEALGIAVEAGAVERALATARERLAADPHQPRLRIALALLLTDLRRRDEARAVLLDGYADAARRELLQLVDATSELGDEDAFQSGLETLRARGGDADRDRLDALLLEVGHLRARQRRDAAVRLLLDARATFDTPTAKVRLGEALESLDRLTEAIELYRAAYEATHTEDLAFRLAWLLSSSRDDGEREESARLFRHIWLEAGSAARRVQAEERVLDQAAREGRLADLVIELERALAAPDTEHREAKRDALVKIWSRAQDTFGARQVLLDWAREHPEDEIECWQRIAQLHLENQEFVAHEKTLRHLLELDPERELDYRQQLALGFLERGRPAEARAVIRELLEGGGEADAIAFEFSAGIMSLAGRHEDAARLYRRALARHPDRIETLLLWANSMAALDRRELAIGRFLDLLLDESIADDLFLVAVDGLLNLEAPPPALRFAERALERRVAGRPDKIYLYRGLQDVLEALGDDDARLLSLDETLVVAGLQRTAWLRELMDESARRRDTTGYLKHALALLRSGDEVPPEVFLEIGEVRLGAGDLRGAEGAFERARLAPDFAAIERRIAELYETKNRLADAERVRRRILRRDPTNPAAILGVARIVELRGARGEALPAYRDAALMLLDGLDLGATTAEAPRPGTQLNRNDEGPGWEDAFDGALRCAETTGDLAPLRTRLVALVTSADPAATDAQKRLGLVDRLGALALAFGDEAGVAQVAELEDLILRGAPEDAKLRNAIVDARLARGDLDAARQVLDALPDSEAKAARRQLALLEGRPEDVVASLREAPVKELLVPLRDLVATGHAELARPLLDRIESAATAEEDGAARVLALARGLFGISHDDSAEREAALRDALVDDSGNLRARVGRIANALRQLPDVDEQRARDVLAALIPAVVAEGEAQSAYTLLNAALGVVDGETLAPLVPIAMKGVTRSYSFSSYSRFLELLPVPDAVALAEDTLKAFPEAEIRSVLLRSLAGNELPRALQTPLIEDLRLRDLQPADTIWMVRLVKDADLEPDAAASLVRILKRDRPRAPETGLLEARFAAADSEARRTALLGAAELVRNDDQPDYGVMQALEMIAELADGPVRTALLGAPVRDRTADLLLRAELLRRDGRRDEAADVLAGACRRQPDNLSLQNRARPLLLEAGRRREAIELFLQWAAQAQTVYPYQATQIARLLVEEGRAVEAVELLERSEDPRGTALLDRLRAIVAIDDPAVRAPKARAWLLAAQSATRSARRAGVIMLGGMERESHHTPGDVLAPPSVPTAAPATPADAEEAGDLLAFLPEGCAIAEALLRATPIEQRDRDPALYRGVVGGALRTGEIDALLADARRALATRPCDAEALRILTAAAQLGLAVDVAELRRALTRRTLATGADVQLLLDAIPTAAAAGLDALRDGLLATVLSDRDRLGNYQLRDRIGATLGLAARSRPDLLLRLVPNGSANAWLDGDLLTALVPDAPDAAAVLERFRAVGRQLEQPGTQHWAMRMALPWCGLCLRAGRVDDAIAALAVDDPQVELGDRFPAQALAAAIPALSSWSDPGDAEAAAAALLDALDAARAPGRRSLLFRLTALLAIRLDTSNATDAAASLRAALATRSDGSAEQRAWLEATG